MKFYFDENVPVAIAAFLRKRGVLPIPGSFRANETRPIGEALLRVQGQYPHGFGEYVVMYLPRP